MDEIRVQLADIHQPFQQRVSNCSSEDFEIVSTADNWRLSFTTQLLDPDILVIGEVDSLL
jgi:hypothetical protein